MSIRKISTVMPHPTTLGTPFDNFPQGWTYPPVAVLRQALVDAGRDSADVEIANYGTVQIRRDGVWLDWKLSPVPSYLAKHPDAEISGRWAR